MNHTKRNNCTFSENFENEKGALQKEVQSVPTLSPIPGQPLPEVGLTAALFSWKKKKIKFSVASILERYRRKEFQTMLMIRQARRLKHTDTLRYSEFSLYPCIQQKSSRFGTCLG